MFGKKCFRSLILLIFLISFFPFISHAETVKTPAEKTGYSRWFQSQAISFLFTDLSALRNCPLSRIKTGRDKEECYFFSVSSR